MAGDAHNVAKGKLAAAKGKTQNLAAGAAEAYVVAGGSPKKPSWSLKLYLMMCDIRRWAQVTPRDITCLRGLADSGGAVGLPLVDGVDSKSEDFDGVKCT